MSSSRLGRWWIGLYCLSGLMTPGATLADEASLIAEPASCIALHRGQRCFRQIVLLWRVPPGPARHCIERVGDAEPLRCWHGKTQGRLSVAYASDTEQRFRLTGAGPAGAEPRDVLAETRVETAWVYRGSRRGTSGWRLF